jgi:hypothetical protein
MGLEMAELCRGEVLTHQLVDQVLGVDVGDLHWRICKHWRGLPAIAPG